MTHNWQTDEGSVSYVSVNFRSHKHNLPELELSFIESTFPLARSNPSIRLKTNIAVTCRHILVVDL